jgi:S1-C subfamily serine protease
MRIHILLLAPVVTALLLATPAFCQSVPTVPAPLPGAEDKWARGFGLTTVVTSEGIRISLVAPGGVAERVGLTANDYIREVNGRPVGIVKGLSFSLESEFRSATGAVTLKVLDGRSRREREVVVTVEAGGAPKDLPPSESLRPLGQR